MTSPLSDDKEDEEGIDEEPLNEEIEADDFGDIAPIEGDPEEPGKTETLSLAPDTFEIDKLIGRGLKLPQVQDDGHW